MSPPHPRSVLIIGGGPVGLVTLRNFLERGDFEKVELVERRDDIGGVWYLDSPKDDGRTRWPSPAYPGLMGNVLPRFLSFSGLPFPPPPSSPDQPFPSLLQTYEYLRKFAEPLFKTGKIRLNTEVARVEELKEGAGWKVDLKYRKDGSSVEELAEVWDAVIIATAYYDNPTWPDTEGLDEARQKGIAKHAKVWDGPIGFEGKRVVVVGNANSGNDISSQMAPVAADPGIYRSIRRPNMFWFPMLPHPRMVDVAPVARYSFPTPDKTTLHLQDGTEIPDVEHVFLGTGYAAAAPFVRVLSASGDTLAPLTDPSIRPRRIPALHRHILYARNPTLAFLGGVVSAIPFVLGDLTSTWLALAWAQGPQSIAYPDTPDGRLESERVRLEAIATIRASMENPTSLIAYHVLGPEELPYARALREEVLKVRPEFGEGQPEARLIEWSDEMWAEKEGMFGLKADILNKQAEGINA